MNSAQGGGLGGTMHQKNIFVAEGDSALSGVSSDDGQFETLAGNGDFLAPLGTTLDTNSEHSIAQGFASALTHGPMFDSNPAALAQADSMPGLIPLQDVFHLPAINLGGNISADAAGIFISGTSGIDFIHEAGDGAAPPPGTYHEISTATENDDTVYG